MGYINNVYPSWYIDINIISFFGDISVFMRIYQKFGYILLQYIVIYRRIDISKYINSGYIAIYREISWYIAEYLEISRYIFSFLTNLLISTAKFERFCKLFSNFVATSSLQNSLDRLKAVRLRSLAHRWMRLHQYFSAHQRNNLWEGKSARFFAYFFVQNTSRTSAHKFKIESRFFFGGPNGSA